MNSKTIFTALAREGECWHEITSFDVPAFHYLICTCGAELFTFQVTPHIKHFNPDFSTWEGFGWAWERAQEKEWWREFCYFADAQKKAKKAKGFLGEYIIHPTRFIEALGEFLEGRK